MSDHVTLSPAACLALLRWTIGALASIEPEETGSVGWRVRITDATMSGGAKQQTGASGAFDPSNDVDTGAVLTLFESARYGRNARVFAEYIGITSQPIPGHSRSKKVFSKDEGDSMPRETVTPEVILPASADSTSIITSLAGTLVHAMDTLRRANEAQGDLIVSLSRSAASANDKNADRMLEMSQLVAFRAGQDDTLETHAKAIAGETGWEGLFLRLAEQIGPPIVLSWLVKGKPKSGDTKQIEDTGVRFSVDDLRRMLSCSAQSPEDTADAFLFMVTLDGDQRKAAAAVFAALAAKLAEPESQ